MRFGFSYVGFLYLIFLFLPNITWAKKKPEGYSANNEKKYLLTFERIGQVLVTTIALICSNFNYSPVGWWNIWLILSALLMLLCEICWIRYFKNPTVANFYRKFCGIPIPLATLPVSAFFLLGIYGKVVLMLISAVILGIGHIGIHLQHRKNYNIN